MTSGLQLARDDYKNLRAILDQVSFTGVDNARYIAVLAAKLEYTIADLEHPLLPPPAAPEQLELPLEHTASPGAVVTPIGTFGNVADILTRTKKDHA